MNHVAALILALLGADPAAAAAPRDVLWTHPRPVAPPVALAPAKIGLPASVFLSANEDPEGDMPRNVVFTPDGAEIAIVHRDTDNVTFFDVATMTPAHTVPVGDFPVDVAVSPDGQYALTANVLSHTVSIIDLDTHAVAAEVPVTGEQPFKVLVTSDSAFAVVGIINDGIASAFSVIDLDTLAEVGSFPSAPQGVIGFFFSLETGKFGNLFTQFALTPDGTTVILPDRGGDRVVLYDRASGAEVASLATAPVPTSVDVAADGSVAVVGHESGGDSVTVIDLAGPAVCDNFPTAALVSQVIRITPDNAFAIAAISNNAIFVDLATGATTSTVSTGTVGDIELSHDGQYAFVSNFNARVISLVTQSEVGVVPFAPCADAAASPTELRAVALNNRFAEDVHFYDIDGASASLEGAGPSGVPDEGDATRNLDVSADGRLAVASNTWSSNVVIYDLDNEVVRGYVDVGVRAQELAIAPDRRHAVVCALDADAVVVVDLLTDTAVATLPIVSRPARVRISPDGLHAYVLNIAGTDLITFIALDGADSAILSQVSAGQTGSALGYPYTELSGIELTDDGSLLAVCDSFNDLLRLYDTKTRTEVDTVGVGDFPIRVAFSPDGTRAYVANAFSDDVSVVNIASTTGTLIATVPGIDAPLTLDVDGDGGHLYVGNSGNDAGVRVVDATSHAVVQTILFADGSPRDSHLDRTAGVLYAAATSGELVRISAAGPASAIIDSVPISGGPSDMAFSDSEQAAVVAQPILDGIDLVRFAPPCPGDVVGGDGVVDTQDLLTLLGAWGGDDPLLDVAPPGGDGMVDVVDLLAMLGAWGPCPKLRP